MGDNEMNSSTDLASSERSASKNPLSRKLNKLLENRLDNDKDTLEALKALSTFFDENNLRTRRNLRGDIEKRSLNINEEYVGAFKQVKEKLDDLYQDVEAMNICCNDMTSRLKAAKVQTNDLIRQTTTLQNESQRLKMRQEVASSFLDAFQLKPEEIRILRGTKDGELDLQFFNVLERIKNIHNDCKVLLRIKQQTAGLEIMEMMAMHLEAAYEKLYRWAQGECRMQNSESTEVSQLLCMAMKSLKERPLLFKYTLDEFGTARRAAVVRSFIDALTRGGPGGIPRPIELHSHDPMRYVGDMLAWLHQSSASEKECIESLLKMCDYAEKKEDVRSSLGHITEGVYRPLKVRLEQIIVSEPGAVTMYKLSNLLKFYHETIREEIPEDSSLLMTLTELFTLSHKMFINSLVLSTTKLVEKVELPPADLSPTEALNQSLTLLKEVLACHDSAVISLDDKQKDFSQILSCMIDPLLQMCHVSASKLIVSDMATYLINCIHKIHSTLALYEFTDSRLEMLQAEMTAHLDTLTSEQASYVIAHTGMGSIYKTVLEHQPKNGPLAEFPSMDVLAIKSAMSKFDSYLSSPDSLLLPQAMLIQSPNHRQSLRKRSLELIHSSYALIYNGIVNPESGYQEPTSLVLRTPDQVKALLCVS